MIASVLNCIWKLMCHTYRKSLKILGGAFYTYKQLKIASLKFNGFYSTSY